MDKKIVEKIFEQNNLGSVDLIEKVEIGFTNTVYSIDDQYIIKICTDEANEANFEKEVFLCTFFKDVVPAPDIIVYDDSKRYLDQNFVIYPKIPGENLYARWHLMTREERRDVIKQLCLILKSINNADYTQFLDRYNLSHECRWMQIIESKIARSLSQIKEKNMLSVQFTSAIEQFIEKNKVVLEQQKMALVYWDAHFDNVLVKNNRVVGLLDFERTEFASIDFMLDTIKRMVDRPKKYMSAASEKYARKEDYADLLVWFEEFYPELFSFADMELRLKLYALEHDLSDLSRFLHVPVSKHQIAQIIQYKE